MSDKWDKLKAEARHWFDVATKQGIAYRSIDKEIDAARADGERSAWNICLRSMEQLEAEEVAKKGAAKP